MPVSERLYLDHAATTPVLPAAREAMAQALAEWANPSSPHLDGRGARQALEGHRRRLKELLQWDGEVIFTGGASEAIKLALQGKAERHIVSPVEHDAVLRPVPDAVKLAVDLQGRVVLSSIARALEESAGQALVAIQSVNNETGVIQPLAEIGETVRAHGGIWLCDCSQSVGKLPLPDADMISLSAHKFGGPPGVGALLVKDLALLEPSGGQEKGYRAGTENLPAVASMIAALEQPTNWHQRIEDLRHQLDRQIEAAGGLVVAKDADRLPTIGSYQMPGVSANAQLIQFDLAGVAVSAGSACSSGTLKTSHVLHAMGWDDKAAGEVIRVSFGPDTNRSDIYRFVEIWQGIAEKAKA
ncbi:cysteine desulfurase family protein [Alterisphingorhabdus coralli]|uniref:Cysteine desulfurase n=1 Tax=Alterisphingorhabdus coralli TaxID=3071408 RepID=A0AA97I126_9SPHN|nr:cysteine desulfurase family protein [Parasphingorhabdus sp. SCSIO 66989]WOE76294.1 cysteine desulfurase family protein [Parasphingorhabdus sp. SCSIO 66989]